MRSLLVQAVKKILYYIFGYQVTIDWNKRIAALGQDSIYNNNTDASSREKTTLLQNECYFNIICKFNVNRSQKYRVLNFGCGWGRHFKMLEKATNSKYIIGYDPFVRNSKFKQIVTVIS
jgi:hypothetical protein